MSQAKVTIIGRPNVGKSSFFNMFVGHKIAIVADEAGTTRDISEYDMIDQDTGISYIVADSGGLDFGSKEDEVAVDIIERTKMAIQESQLLIWLVEYDGFTTLDEQIYDVLRKQSKIPYVLVANKADNETKRLEAYSIAGKGEEMFFPISVSHNYGLKDIKIWVAKYLQSQGYVAPEVDS
ncbi:MAG: 50S ribosome-binding GTPase [Candidatus Peribacteria bacterium]|nr:MAG: 50S ribosome-binding GTPase [Candidatus Peribacteria bacterium]